jgi:hypothetical protein
MPAPLATRRAVRPDGRHYRQTRRHASLPRIGRGRGGARTVPLLAVALFLAWWGWHGQSSAAHLLGFGGAAILILAAFAAPALGRR